MPTNDPSIFAHLAQWLWVGLAAPIAYVWRQATCSVTRTELKEVADEARNERGEIKDMIHTQFANAERDRANTNEGFKELTKVVTQIHVDLIDRINQK
jgi:hypothetical protein